MENGILSKILAWFFLPTQSDTTLRDWFLFLGLILIVSFLWKTVVDEIIER